MSCVCFDLFINTWRGGVEGGRGWRGGVWFIQVKHSFVFTIVICDKVELLFFSSQQKLLNAMSPLYSRLTEEELNRNKHGPCLLYTYDSALNFPVSSSLPGKFPDLSCCHARYEFLWHEHSDTLRFWVLLMTLKGTDGKLLWLEISTCNICSSVGCLNCNSTIGLRSIKFYTNNNYLL